MRRARAVTLATLAGTVLAAAPAAAKPQTHARLDNAAQVRAAAPGERVRIAWTLDGAAQLPIPAAMEHARVRGFGVFVSARGVDGAIAKVPARPARPGTPGFPAGPYVAELTVPQGGIESLAISVEAAQIRPAVVPIDNPFPAATGADATPPPGLVAALLAAFALLVATVAARTARRPLA